MQKESNYVDHRVWPEDEERINVIGQNGNTGLHYLDVKQKMMEEHEMAQEQTILDEYQHFTPSTALYPKSRGLDYCVSGLASEAGEVAGVYKKFIRDGESAEDFRQKMKAEMGDVMWYLSELANSLGLTLNEIVLYNRDKLIDRQNRNVIKGSGDDR